MEFPWLSSCLVLSLDASENTAARDAGDEGDAGDFFFLNHLIRRFFSLFFFHSNVIYLESPSAFSLG